MHWFIVPDLDGPISGGTRYNRNLLAALAKAGFAARILPIRECVPVLAGTKATDCFWVDSLYIDQVPALVRLASRTARVGLLLHYLPSLIARPDGPLSAAELEALAVASAFLVPSAFMRAMVDRFTRPGRPVLDVEPGRPGRPLGHLPAPSPVRAVMVANLVPGKGVEAFLNHLAARVRSTDAFQLTVIGGSTFDAGYARRCMLAAESPTLAGRICFAGALPAEETLSCMTASNLLVSASVMESYGMALAEARTLGLPVLAVGGGNVGALVSPASGGEVVADAEALVAAYLALARDVSEHRVRLACAYRNALPARPWRMAAQSFMDQVKGDFARGTGRLASAVDLGEGYHGG